MVVTKLIEKISVEKPTSEEFSGLSIDDSMKKLQTNSTGLSTSEVSQRLVKFGYNEVKEKQENDVIKFARKFWGFTAVMMWALLLLTWFMNKYSEFYLIVALLLLNATLSFLKERKASSAVEFLKKKLQVNARVLRDDIWSVIPSRELVPGDIIRLRSGDFVPADTKIIEGDLEVDQSALTGESLPVEKKVSDLIYSASIIRRGESNGLVISTGIRTKFGKVTQLVQIARPKLHTEVIIAKIVKIFLIMVSSLIGVIFLVSALKGISFLQTLPLALALLISAVPIALPAMFTLSMAMGAKKLTEKGVLVTKLSASENASTMNTLFIDKTGTITSNKLSLTDLMGVGIHTQAEVLFYSALSSNDANNDPIDMAIIKAAKERNIATNTYIQKRFVPFDPITRKTESILEKDGKEFTVIKGAVSIIMPLCKVQGMELQSVESKINEFAQKGYRTIAIATNHEKSNVELVGIIAFYDMPRPDSTKLIEELRSLGISVKMLTGDSLPIAKEIARQTKLGDKIIRMSDLGMEITTNDTELAEVVKQNEGIAEIYPEDKYHIVKSLQSQKQIVGMTGDGVNDAPALRQADVGIAVSTSTDVAKGASSVVLTREGLANVIDLVKTGRKIHQRIITWILGRVIKTYQVAFFIVIAFILTGLHVVDDFDIIIMLFLTDFVGMSISTDNVRGSKKPDTWNVTGFVKVATGIGIVAVIESLVLLYMGMNYLNLSNSVPKLQTFVLCILMFSQMCNMLISRERRHFWESRPSKMFLSAIIGNIAVTVIIATIGLPGISPIPLIDVLLVLAYSLSFPLLINDFVKVKLVKLFVNQ
jgi:H+-transporting ATPase